MAVLRRFSVAARIITLAVAALVTLLVLAGLSITAGTKASRAQDEAARVQDVHARTLEARYLLADLHGRQTGYAFDVSLRGALGARDGSPARAAFLDAAAATQEALGALEETAAGLGDNTTSLTAARASTDELLALDQQAVALYLTDSEADRVAGDRLVLRQGLEQYQAASAQLDEFADALEEHRAEAMAAASRASRGAVTTTLVVALTIIALCAPWVIMLSRSIRIPLRHLRLRLQAIAEGDGDLTARLDEDGQDDLAEIARLFNAFVADVATTVRDVAESASTLAAATEQLSATTDRIAGAAQDTSTQAGTVAGASEQISATVESFSQGAGQLRASIDEIARSAGEAAEVTSSAVHLAEEAGGTVRRLGEAGQEIGGVVAVIESIASQTNLLALNATIEAARAGEAGRGFAVVAGEVKELAQETARATSDVSRRIEQIQLETDAAVAAIARISEVVDRVSAVSASIAGAVEEQTAVAAEMSRSTDEVAGGSRSITSSISTVAASAEASSTGIEEARLATAELARMGERLSALVSRFTA
ncbi:hypothetical protein GCM10028777_15570 [Angustibacter speluncae]